MEDCYTPSADFLVMVANEDVLLFGNLFADANLKLLITYTRDADVSNRDWATMLLAQTQIDTPEVRSALLNASNDEDVTVRGEAPQGLAQREKGLALPLLRRELESDECAYAVFQAACDLADASLVDGLRRWVGRGGASWIDDEICDALAACSANHLAE